MLGGGGLSPAGESEYAEVLHIHLGAAGERAGAAGERAGAGLPRLTGTALRWQMSMEGKNFKKPQIY